MTNNEMLLAISNLLDEKIDSKIDPIKKEIETLKNEQVRIQLVIENEVRGDIKMCGFELYVFFYSLFI